MAFKPVLLLGLGLALLAVAVSGEEEVDDRDARGVGLIGCLSQYHDELLKNAKDWEHMFTVDCIISQGINSMNQYKTPYDLCVRGISSCIKTMKVSEQARAVAEKVSKCAADVLLA